MMSDEISIASSLTSVSRLLTMTSIGLAAVMGTSYLAGPGGGPKTGASTTVVGAQHVPTDRLQEMHHVQRMRAPLHDFFGIELETEEPDPKAPGESEKLPRDVWQINEKLDDKLKEYDLEFLVMTVADPQGRRAL
jgi:hypothetical protein